MTDYRKVAIVLVNWNGKKDTEECIESILKSDYQNFEIIVVDNGSTDGSPHLFREKFPSVTVIENGENLGFAKANNIGVKWAQRKLKPDYFFILNNDTVIDRGCLRELIQAAETHTKAGIITPLIYYADPPDLIWAAGGTIGLGLMERMNEFREKDFGKIRHVQQVDWASGCAMLVRSDLLTQTYLFDEDYFIYGEDMEFSIRARKLGYDILLEPRAKIWHRLNASSSRKGPIYKYYHMARNKVLTVRKHGSFTQWFFFLTYYLARRILWVFIRSSLSGKPRIGVALLRGLFDGMKLKTSRPKGHCA